ncbi:unnamed protein product [Lactuca saligna]|uniref:Uncharacterized protein n=1 Tax=Lactuca saligna TaxID=75948 RepID=A0AA35YBW0_LACSI|nr:unnamed protein product [Lactuca saligna]
MLLHENQCISFKKHKASIERIDLQETETDSLFVNRISDSGVTFDVRHIIIIRFCRYEIRIPEKKCGVLVQKPLLVTNL